jgi:transcriptional regulator with XRE-family HTH domain
MNPERIRDIRKRAGLTQTQFASLLGVQQHTIARWENGKREPARMKVAVLEGIEQRLERQKTEEQKQKLVNSLVAAATTAGLVALLELLFGDKET